MQEALSVPQLKYKIKRHRL